MQSTKFRKKLEEVTQKALAAQDPPEQKTDNPWHRCPTDDPQRRKTVGEANPSEVDSSTRLCGDDSEKTGWSKLRFNIPLLIEELKEQENENLELRRRNTVLEQKTRGFGVVSDDEDVGIDSEDVIHPPVNFGKVNSHHHFGKVASHRHTMTVEQLQQDLLAASDYRDKADELESALEKKTAEYEKVQQAFAALKESHSELADAHADLQQKYEDIKEDRKGKLSAKIKTIDKQRSTSAAMLIQMAWKASSAKKKFKKLQSLLEKTQLELADARQECNELHDENARLESDLQELEEIMCNGEFDPDEFVRSREFSKASSAGFSTLPMLRQRSTWRSTRSERSTTNLESDLDSMMDEDESSTQPPEDQESAADKLFKIFSTARKVVAAKQQLQSVKAKFLEKKKERMRQLLQELSVGTQTGSLQQQSVGTQTDSSHDESLAETKDCHPPCRLPKCHHLRSSFEDLFTLALDVEANLQSALLKNNPSPR